jgi:hypothetical protein
MAVIAIKTGCYMDLCHVTDGAEACPGGKAQGSELRAQGKTIRIRLTAFTPLCLFAFLPLRFTLTKYI